MDMRETLIRLLLEQPFYGHVAASLSITEGNAGTIAAAFDGYPRITYNRAWLEAQPPDIAAGVLMHQLLHLMLLHPFRRNGREEALWAIACDMAVNEHIPPRMLAKDAVTVAALRREVAGLRDMAGAEEYYEAIKKRREAFTLMQTEAGVKGVLSDGREVSCDTIEESDDDCAFAQMKGLLSDKVRLASEEAECGAALSVQLDRAYRSERLNWRSILKRFITGRGRLTTRKTYRRVSKRFDDFPGNRRASGVDVLVAVDESGSIPPATFSAFYAEVLSIHEITGVSMMVTRFDTSCTKPVPAWRFALDPVRVKSGGTDFRPVFALADSLRIPLLILFTDGDGPAPESANQKTLWVLTPGGKKPPFGESVVCDIAEGA